MHRKSIANIIGQYIIMNLNKQTNKNKRITMKLSTICCIIYLFIYCGNLYAQHTSKLYFKTLDIYNGLSHNPQRLDFQMTKEILFLCSGW